MGMSETKIIFKGDNKSKWIEAVINSSLKLYKKHITISTGHDDEYSITIHEEMK
jgi:hypothetical protein